MSPHTYAVWEWLGEDGKPVYVGFGKIEAGVHPAQMIWKNHNTVNSDLNVWLREHKKEPSRCPKMTSSALHRRDAKGVAHARRMKLKKGRTLLLSSRPHGTVIGGGKKRAVISPDGDIYESVRAAADDLGINPCTIVRRCNSPNSPWSYLDAETDD